MRRGRGGQAAERDLGRRRLVSGAGWQAELRRYAVPFLVLVLVTAGALAGRRALRDDEPRASVHAKPAQRAAPRVAVKRAATKFYIVESGDTLGSIAGQFETSVDRLLELNPAVDPRALRVGQRVRVG
jgi:Tfp pilus assembly protein FimV